jgi:hypothetical protein
MGAAPASLEESMRLQPHWAFFQDGSVDQLFVALRHGGHLMVAPISPMKSQQPSEHRHQIDAAPKSEVGRSLGWITSP